MSQRTDQVASTLRRLLQEALARGLNDPRIRGLVSVTSVRVSDDLADATVRISVLPDRHAALAVKGLQHAAGHLQERLARGTSLRRVPRLHFEQDPAMRNAAAVESALKGIPEEMPEASPAPEPERGEGHEG